MPNKWTFTIKPIKELISRYVDGGIGWIDPFAGKNSPAEFTNDLNQNNPATHHLDAFDFLKIYPGPLNGCLFDPPYSPRQIKECYESIGLKMTQKDGQRSHSWSSEKNIIKTTIKPGGIVICCDWNSMGMGKNRGFEFIEILLVSHGAGHNDTIVTVEKRINNNLDAYVSV